MTPWAWTVAMLTDPERESRRLAALLTGWPPVAVRRHWITDDLVRRHRREVRA